MWHTSTELRRSHSSTDPVENNLLDQVKYLSEQLYNALGFTESVFNGTADAETNLSYYNRTVKPILDTITKSATMVFPDQDRSISGSADHLREGSVRGNLSR